MKIDITYPPASRRKFQRRRLINITKWPMLFGAYICTIMNIITGGYAWCLIVDLGLYMAWTLLVSTDLVEYNRLSQFIKLALCSCVMLVLIDAVFRIGFAVEAAPIAAFTALAISAALFFTDLERQKQNMLPMLMLIFLSLVSSAAGLCIWRGENRWALAVMGAFALALLAACVYLLGREFLQELRKRFHVR